MKKKLQFFHIFKKRHFLLPKVGWQDRNFLKESKIICLCRPEGRKTVIQDNDGIMSSNKIHCTAARKAARQFLGECPTKGKTRYFSNFDRFKFKEKNAKLTDQKGSKTVTGRSQKKNQ